MSGVFNGKQIEQSLRILDIFNSSNEQRIVKHKIDYKEFYNDAINKEVTLKDHILSWISEKEKARKLNKVYDRYSSFNLCNYPWILDTANKNEIMKHQYRYI